MLMIVLGLLIILGTLFGALLLFGVWRSRPKRVEIVTGVIICVSLLSMFGMSEKQDELEAMIDDNFESMIEFTDCFDEGVEDYENDWMYLATETMIDCATDLVNNTVKTYDGYYE